MSDWSGWSAPNAEGIRNRPLGGRKLSERRRVCRAQALNESALPAWPADGKALAAQWLRNGSASREWTTLERMAGEQRMGLAHEMLDLLLTGGWIELKQRWAMGRDWLPVELRWLHARRLAVLLGLPDVHDLRVQAESMREAGFSDPRLPALADTLSGSAGTALRRLELLRKLDQWLAEGRQGTRREFAHFARGDTKQVSEKEWEWLDDALGLEAIGVSAHSPGLWVRAPLSLRLPQGCIDLAAALPALAIPPQAFDAAVIEGRIVRWRVIENRTSFEQAARAHGGTDGVLWLPGFAPTWWRAVVAGLLVHVPAPALIACDPDPAGIRIAMQAGALWEEAGLEWRPWRMGADDLHLLRASSQLNGYDRAELARLGAVPLPPVLQKLADTLTAGGRKGEQEGFDFSTD